MFRNQSFTAVFTMTLLVLATQVAAQSSSPAPGVPQSAASGSSLAAAEATKPVLRIQLVINRFENEKKIGSLPYTFIVTPKAGPMSIRFGVEVPVPVASGFDQGKSGPVDYRSLGTNIDCSNVRELSPDRFQFDINLQNSAALPGTEADGKESRPLFRRFDTTFTAVLRDGQSMQTIASTNPVTGEVVKIDVTLNVVR